MIINKVTINNFYCFLEENEFPFEKGLNIISALNSGGKSQFFNAFYWTLFDMIYCDNANGKKEWKTSSNIIVCPDKLRNETSLGEKIESWVEIILTDEYHGNIEPKEELVEYRFLKKVIYKKEISDLSIYVKPELEISFIRNGETDFIPSHHYNSFLEKIFPSSIRKFMWYQGETMDELYDFSKPSTLKNAIKEISYYPMYDNMHKIVSSSSASIERKLEKELMKKDQLTEKEKQLITNITQANQSIEHKKNIEANLVSDIERLQDEIAEIEHDLKNYDKYRDIKQELTRYETELEATLEKVTDCDIYIKETLINKWMLNGCEKLINDSLGNLNILNEEIQKFQQSTNPVPLNLPGPEYVERMLEDGKCYICEREVLVDTPAYEALKKRLNDFEKSANNKILQDNYTELNRARRRLVSELPDIKEQILENQNRRTELIKKSNSLKKKINGIYENSGQDDGASIFTGAATASQLLQKMQSIRHSIDTKKSSHRKISSELEQLRINLENYKSEGDKLMKNTYGNIVESQASDYIKMFVKSISRLSAKAHSKLIAEIQEESNKLYSLYLGGKEQGVIEIDTGIRIVDKATRETLTELNTAELVAQKLSVANAFLSLSEKKMKRSYPIVADAPTSDFDADNTYNLTLNIGGSFEQMIIMSKDYASFSESKRNDLIREAKIVKFYELKNELIDKNGIDSRINKKTFTTIIK